jgi:hypothetical protein
MSQSATGQSIEPSRENRNSSVSVWKIGAGVFLGIAGIIGLILVIAIWQIMADSMKEVRSAGTDAIKTVRRDTLCASSVDDLFSGRGQKIFLFTGDTVKPQMVTGSYANVLPVTGRNSSAMPKGCWMSGDDLQ